ncbi:MAG: terminase small subunit [Methyloceanibacter sp.]
MRERPLRQMFDWHANSAREQIKAQEHHPGSAARGGDPEGLRVLGRQGDGQLLLLHPGQRGRQRVRVRGLHAIDELKDLILTPKQRRFCEESLIDLNAKQAAIRAGYSPNTAPSRDTRTS